MPFMEKRRLGRFRCSARLLRGGNIGGHLSSGSIYARAHPAYHHSQGEKREDDEIASWRLTLLALWAVNMTLANATEELRGEVALESYHVGHLLLPRHYKAPDGEIFVLLLWPIKFEGDRCILLALMRTGNGASMNTNRWEE
jgi:hypothetical protein